MPVSNEKVYEALFYIKSELPLQILEKLSMMPYIGSAKKREQVKNYQRLTFKMKNMQSLFFHFMNKEYVYQQPTSDLIW